MQCGSHIMRKRGRSNEPDSGVDVTSLAGPAYDRELDVALMLGRSHGGPRYPWEVNGFLRDVLGPCDIPWLRPPTSLRSLSWAPPPVAPTGSSSMSQPAKREFVRRVAHEAVQDSPDSERDAALMRWCEILMINPEKTKTGRMLISCAGEAQRVLQSLQDTFRTKATSTLKIRVGSISLYVGWHRLSYPDDDIFPIDEAKAYEYACMCRDTKASASRVDTFVSTLRFLGEFLEFEGASAAATSPRVQGASHQMLLARPPRIRARMLTIGMLCWLEIACFAMHHAFDRMVAGLCMLCCMGRLRCSDANRIRHAGLLGRFLEGSLTRTKTALSKEKATSFIPLVVPAFGILGKPWLLEFLQARRELGLRELPTLASRAHDLSFVLVPNVITMGLDNQRPMSSVELSDRMRALLSKGFNSDDLQGLSSHSLKATLLAYINIYGCDLGTSELLGHHANRMHSSALNYTRDSMSAPIRELVKMFRDISAGVFNPCASRDQTFPAVADRKQITALFFQETGLHVMDAAQIMMDGVVFASYTDRCKATDRLVRLRADYSLPTMGLVTYLTDDEEMALRGVASADSPSDTGSDSSVTSSSDSEEELEQEAGLAAIDLLPTGSMRAQPSDQCDTMLMYRHSRTKMLHCGHVSSCERTGCGRQLSEAYYLFKFKGDSDPVFPKCKICFGSVQV